MTEEHTLLGLLADIRAAAGDREGRLMQAELVEHIRTLKLRADQADTLSTKVTELEALRSEAAQLSHQFRNERDQWKANHDNQVALKAALLDRPDLKERAALVQSLAAERDHLRAEVEALRACLSEHLRAAVACQNSVVETRGADGMDRLSFANDKARALLAQPSTPWVNPLAAEVEALKSALTECADDLEAEVNARASGELPRRIERDLEPVRKARALLAQPAGTWVNPLAAEVEKLRAASVIEWEPGRSYTAAELLRRAIRGLRVRKGRPVWPAVMNLFGVGSNVGHYLCRWAGRDPDTGKDIAARKGEGSEG